MTDALPALMTEYPGFVPWHVAGDPWFTFDEIESLINELKRRGDERRKANDKAKASAQGRRTRRPAKRRR